MQQLVIFSRRKKNKFYGNRKPFASRSEMRAAYGSFKRDKSTIVGPTLLRREVCALTTPATIASMLSFQTRVNHTPLSMAATEWKTFVEGPVLIASGHNNEAVTMKIRLTTMGTVTTKGARTRMLIMTRTVMAISIWVRTKERPIVMTIK